MATFTFAAMGSVVERKTLEDRLETASTRTPSPASSLGSGRKVLPAGILVPFVHRHTFLEFGIVESSRRRSASCEVVMSGEHVVKRELMKLDVEYPGMHLSLDSAVRAAVRGTGVLIIVGLVSEVLTVEGSLEVRGMNASISGVRVIGSGNLRISDVHVAGSVAAGQTAEVRMEDCSISASVGSGVVSCGRSRVSLMKCRISECAENGASAMDESRLSLQGCIVESNGWGHGVHLASAGVCVLGECMVRGNGRNGVVVMSSKAGEGVVVLRGCSMTGNLAYGLAVHGGSAVRWEGGELSGNRMGDCQGKRLVQGWEEAPKRKKKTVSRRLL
eukprot:CAMPEP_0204257966 /NCGR_PEP_ID=MMETSP0468-20130131/4735_1 /ASSEMBLY_ACC=CAM_ASM_000383 /TAXON_ID=2969 /ORGANISM="Oxyrrhis marina" /LENGTH=330 /DNA_ID=CAMNT_0051232139 /DNA_START=35 /DNA_END=1027 /DNA_ORIENTATION=-